MPLRPLLRKNIVVRSNQTGSKAEMKAALDIFASGKVVPELEIVHIDEINDALDRIKNGEVMGKLVADLRDGDARNRAPEEGDEACSARL